MKYISIVGYVPYRNCQSAQPRFGEAESRSCPDTLLCTAVNEVQMQSECFLFLSIFLAFYGFIDSTAEEGERKQGEREEEWHAAKGPRPGVEPESAAEPQHMGRPLYH